MDMDNNVMKTGHWGGRLDGGGQSEEGMADTCNKQDGQ